jgi:hypothetical protein
MRRAAALAVALMAAPAAAQVPAPFDRAYELGQTGALVRSERLRTLAFGRALEAGASPRAQVGALRRDLAMQGFYHRGAPAVVDADAALRLLVLGEANLNGGVSEAALLLPGGAVLVPVPPSRAVPGVAVGAAADAALRVAWAPGRVVAVEGGAWGAWAPEAALTLGGARLAACARNHLAGWTFADLCARADRVWRAKSVSRAEAAEASLSQLWSGAATHHEAVLAVGWRDIDGAGQGTLRAEWGAVWPGAATRAGVTLATPADGRVAERLRAFAEVRLRTGAGVMGLTLWHALSDGPFLGSMRHDRTSGASLVADLPGGVAFSLGIVQTVSDAALFDAPQITLGLSLVPRR